MPHITEWSFAADAKGYMGSIIAAFGKNTPFYHVKVEEPVGTTRLRHDFLLQDKNGRPLLTGELKMPDKANGRSPFNEQVVLDAQQKANIVGAKYFFTWNINKLVLWETFKEGVPIIDRSVETFDILSSPIPKGIDARNPSVEKEINKSLTRFLERANDILLGKSSIAALPPDEKFLRVWAYALEQPVFRTVDAIHERYKPGDPFTKQFNAWMVINQGTINSQTDLDANRENIEQAAKYACYVLASQIIFYKALRRKFSEIPTLEISKEVQSGTALHHLLREHFQLATQISGDYETVFRSDWGECLPFLNNDSVDCWRDLIEQTDGFDFTQINYEIIGQIFERMLSPEERHKWGQHYTRSEVVDLINAFCIRNPNDTVLDPACGGGTFLVRAYQRKSDLSAGKLTHEEILPQLFGFDISSYPAHLTAINLATRDLVRAGNYPRVAKSDFFDIKRGDKVFRVPQDGDPHRMLPINRVTAIVGNPP